VWQEVTDLKSQNEIAKITDGEDSVIARKLSTNLMNYLDKSIPTELE
jgi:hypothetical protein